MENRMLCYQCESAADSKCCNSATGICGKTAETSYLQDVLTGALVGLAKASVHKSIDEEIQRLTVEGLCATAAHANFADQRLLALIDRVQEAKKRFRPKYGDHNAGLKIPEDFDIRLIWQKSPDIRSLKSLLLFGIRGTASYAYESWVLGYQNKETATFFHKALIALSANHFKEDYFDLLKEMGEVNLRAMELLHKAKNETYGQPSPVEVPRVIDAGPFIVVSGHHMNDLQTILEQTADTGVNVYSHGEMLPAHAYPAFRKYPHFKGHYGTGWQNQQLEFDNIPAAVVFTSNCVMLPLPSYADRVFTTGTAGLPNIPHIEDNDFRPVLIRAIELNGAPSKITFPGANGGAVVKTGFGQKSLQTLGYKVAGAMADGDIKHIFVIGGCDGCGEDRQFFTDIIHRLPGDAVVLTYGCCKFRFNDIENTTTGGVPKIVDVGQCGDLLHIIGAVEAIAAAAQCRLEELPLTWLLSWQEQRSMANLFSLFAADVHNVILGPKRPPFFTDAVFEAFAKEFNLSILMDEKAPGEEALEEETVEPPYIEAEAEAPAKEEFLDEETLYEETIDKEPLDEEPLDEKYLNDEYLNDEYLDEEPTPIEVVDEEPAAAAEVDPSLSPEELENRSNIAGLPDWAVSDEDGDEEIIEETEAVKTEEKPMSEVATSKINPEDIDQTPDFAIADTEAAAEEKTVTTIVPPLKAAAKPGNKETVPGTVTKKGKKAKAKGGPPQELKEIQPPPKLALPKGAGVSGLKDSETALAAAKKQPYRYTPPQELKEVPPLPPLKLPKDKGVSGLKDQDNPEEAFAAEPPKQPQTAATAERKDTAALAEEAKTEPREAAPALPGKTDQETEAPKISIPKGKGVSGYHDSEEAAASPRDSVKKPYTYNPPRELKEIISPPPLNLPVGAGVSGFSAPGTQGEITPPLENPYSFSESLPEIKIPKGAGVSGWKETDEAAFSAKRKSADDEKSSAKPWLKNSLEELKASLREDNENIATPKADEEAPSTPVTVAYNDTTVPETDTEAPQEAAVPKAATEIATETETEIEAEAQIPLLDEAERRAKPWLENSLQELKASLAEDEEAKKAAGDKPWLAASLKQLKESLVEDGIEPTTGDETARETLPSTPPSPAEIPAETGRKPPVAAKSWQDIVPAKATAPATPAMSPQSQPRPQTEAEITAQTPGGAPPQTWQKPPVAAKPWERDLQQTWQKPATVPKPWQQQPSAMAPGSAPEPAPGVYTQLPNLPLGSPRPNPLPPTAAANPNRYVPRQPGPEIPGNAGVSGYQPTAAPLREMREVMPAPPAEIPYGAGVSGVRYHAEEPPLSPSYDPTYYGVPQKTPKINLPKGVGVSGWQNGEAPIDPAEALRRQAEEESREKTFTAADLLTFTDAASPAEVDADKVYRPGEGEELIATLGPDGKVILAVRNKNKS